MDGFDDRQHARLVGNVLLSLAAFAFGLEIAGLLPDDIFKLPPHYFGHGGAAAIGVLLLTGGLVLRGRKN